MTRRLRPFILALVLLLLHAALVGLIWVFVQSTPNSDSFLAWFLLVVIDRPIIAPLFALISDESHFIVGILALGGAQWFLTGLVLQWLGARLLGWARANF